MNELGRKLKDLSQRAERLDGTHNISIPELLTPEFLSSCSKFNSAEELFQASGFKIESTEDFKQIPDIDWDNFIQGSTSYDCWQEMLKAAGLEWTKKQLGLR